VDAVGALCFLLIAIAALAGFGGYIAGVVRQRNKRPVRMYFVLGLVTGFMAAFVTRRRLGRLVPVARRLGLPQRLILPQRLDNPLTVAALQLRRGLSRTGTSR
jgi:hypothetical protein